MRPWIDDPTAHADFFSDDERTAAWPGMRDGEGTGCSPGWFWSDGGMDVRREDGVVAQRLAWTPWSGLSCSRASMRRRTCGVLLVAAADRDENSVEDWSVWSGDAR
jgi:hypothetical protein